jgi:hypothetical protein
MVKYVNVLSQQKKKDHHSRDSLDLITRTAIISALGFIGYTIYLVSTLEINIPKLY